jgi:P2-related tail formation protein
LKWYDGGGENGITSKRTFEVEVSFSSQNIDFPLFLERLLELFFHAPSLEDMGVLMIFVEKITSSKTSFQMASIY